jgi:hypothetical protein
VTTPATVATAARVDTTPATGLEPATSPPRSESAASGWLSTSIAAVRSSLEGTPGQMRGLAALGVVVALVFGLAAGQAFRSSDGALRRAGANTEQLVRIQAIQTKLVEADADATNAFLKGGLEPAAQRADYASSIASATQLIAEAAQHQPADGNALGALNQAVVAYVSEIEQARANNRQTKPVGAQYLKDASAGLRAQALPILKNLGDANSSRVAEEFDRAGLAVAWLIVFGLLALVVLGLELVWLARRTRRYLNVPLAVGAVVVLVTLVIGALGIAGVANTVDDVRTGVYAATLSTAKARIAGFDAKSNESLTLIARGSGLAFEKQWQASDAAVRAQLGHLARNPASSGLRPLPWADYETVHSQIRALDNGGDWDKAVALATGSGPKQGNGAFARFDSSSGDQLTSLSAQTTSRLDQARGWLPLGGVLGILAGVFAAVCAWWGFSLRLEEYR